MMEFHLRGRLGTGGWGNSSVKNALSSPQIKCEEHLQCSPSSFPYEGIFILLWEKLTSGNHHGKSELSYQHIYFSYLSKFIRFVLLRKSIAAIRTIKETTSYPANTQSQECTELYLLVDNSKHTQIDIRLRAARCDNQRSHDARFFPQSFRT